MNNPFDMGRDMMINWEKSMGEIDAELLRPRGISMETAQPADVSHVESTLEDLQNQLAALRKELHEMR